MTTHTTLLDLIALPHRVSQITDETIERALVGTAAAGITPRQLALLDAIDRIARSEDGAPSQTDLVAATGVDRSTLADVVRRLLKFGLVQRRRTKEDARCYAVRLTDQGRVVLAAARDRAPAIVALLKTRVAGLDALAVLEPVGDEIVRTAAASRQPLAGKHSKKGDRHVTA